MAVSPPFRKILVANRGEIAVRIIRACREMGIPTVAIFSEADRDALHVRYAREAYPVGPAPSAQSYLRIGTILEVAKRAGAGPTGSIPATASSPRTRSSPARAATPGSCSSVRRPRRWRRWGTRSARAS